MTAARVIPIRSIQHYLYCPHRWGLLENDCAWADNYYTAKADLLHTRVHTADDRKLGAGVSAYTALSVYDDRPEYNIYGVIDCLEVRRTADGVEIPGLDGRFSVHIVEYKPTKPKDGDCREEDAMQVFGQKICVDRIFGCDCDAAIYYADVKRRMTLPFRQRYAEYNEKLIKTLSDMRRDFSRGIIPPIAESNRCGGCSLANICLPKLNAPRSVRLSIVRAAEEDFPE